MSSSPAQVPLALVPSRRTIFLAGSALTLAMLAAWYPALSAPFVFDDLPAIVDNASIKHLWPLTTVLTPPADGSGVAGRPIVNLSLALNYAIGGTDVWGYHALNILIHIIASLALFGLVRRTLLVPRLRVTLGSRSFAMGFIVAAIWALHPLQTESVTCVVQRTESLMGCLFLLMCYTFVRGAEAGPAGRRWLAGSVAACALGMGTKEVMITALPMVLLYDRTFLAGSLRAALSQRRRFYLTLAATYLLLWALVVSNGAKRGEAAGFNLGLTAWEYLLTQCQAIVLYLRLAAWPDPLILDYGSPVVRQLGEVWLQAVAIMTLLVATAVALLRSSALGFCGAWFFVILAPSSSVVPLIAQTMAEHRMYLPLAAVVTAIVVSVGARLGPRGLVVGLCLATALGFVAAARNFTYQNTFKLWSGVVDERPDNPRGHYHLADFYGGQPERQVEARAHYETALRLKPDYPEAHNNFANFLTSQPGRQSDALAHYEAALHLKPDYAEAHNNFANFLANQPGRQPDALVHYETALRLKPDRAEAHYNLANFLARQPDRQADALAHFETAVRLKPDYGEAHNNLALLLSKQAGRETDALAHYESALRLLPKSAAIHFNFARQLEKYPGRRREAIAHYSTALTLDPNLTVARQALDQLQH